MDSCEQGLLSGRRRSINHLFVAVNAFPLVLLLESTDTRSCFFFFIHCFLLIKISSSSNDRVSAASTGVIACEIVSGIKKIFYRIVAGCLLYHE